VYLGVRRSINTPAQNSVTNNEINANSVGAIKAKLAISGSETVYSVAPNGAYYKLISNGGANSITSWYELR